MHFDLLCLCYCAILVQTEYNKFACIVYHKTDARVKCANTENEIGGELSCQRMLAFLLFYLQKAMFVYVIYTCTRSRNAL